MIDPTKSAEEIELGGRLAMLSGVDAVGVEHRVSKLATRSLKKDTKRRAIDMAISMVDLTSLEGIDTRARIREMCVKAVRPGGTASSVAAVCVYPDMVEVAKVSLEGSGVKVASVATGFPSGRVSQDAKLADVKEALTAGADEVDMVIDRGALLSGNIVKVYDEVRLIKEACGAKVLKVILETGELGSYDMIKRASWIAMLAGADFIKTSTGKVAVNATRGAALVMCEAARDFAEEYGRMVGVKVAGGIKSSKEALSYLVIANETVGGAWLNPDMFRFGASTLLNDLLAQRDKQLKGVYQRPENYSLG